MALKMSDTPQIEVPKEDEPGTTGAAEVTLPQENAAVRPVDQDVYSQPDALASQIQQVNVAEEARQRAWQQQQAAHQEQLAQERRAREQSDYDSIVNAINGKHEELENAKRDLQDAWQRQDFETAAQAQQRMQDIQIDLKELGKGEGAYAEPQPQQQYYQQPQPQYQPQRPPTATEIIDHWATQGAPLTPEERDYILQDAAHQQLVTTQRGGAALQHAVYEANANGLQRGTPEFIQFVDGIVFPNRNGQTQQAEQSDRRPPVSAPVSRGTHSVTTGRHQESSGKVVLSPQQRDAARFSGVDEVTYAKNLKKLQDLKRQGFYNES
jgi:hypothetical protein